MRVEGVAQERFRSLLALRLAELKSEIPTFSLRQLAKDLGQHPAALSQILSGKRRVSARFAEDMAGKLGVSPSERQKLAESFKTNKKLRKYHLEYGRVPLELDAYDVVAEWRHYVLLALMETHDFRSEEAWMARRLGISTSAVRVTLKRLVALGLAVKRPDGSYRASGKQLITSDGVKSLALRKRHERNLEAARRSLFRDDLKTRDFTFLTMAIDPTRLPDAKKRIRRFQNSLCAFLEGGTRSEVFDVCIQLFPRTIRETKKREKGKAHVPH